MVTLGRSGQAGFTLVETAGVLLLIGVVIALAAPSLQNIAEPLRLDAATRQIATELRLARVRAISLGSNYRVLFRPGAATYVRQRRTGNSYSDDGGSLRLPDGISTASCSSVSGALGFRARGIANEFGTLILTDSSGRRRKIVVNLTGEVRWE